MRVRIIKGTKQIGGCITEISTPKTRIIIDYGLDLDDNSKVFDIDGLTNKEKPLYDAVFITHSHGDHIGLVDNIVSDIPIYVEEKTAKIYDIYKDFCGNGNKIKRKLNTFKIEEGFKGKSILVNDIKITPYMIDHSAYHSCMYLIEADGKRILHTGDFRNHGRNGINFEDELKDVGKIDLLITEGTTLTRKSDIVYEKEEELEERCKELFKKYEQVLILSSSTNIDRTISFYNARGNKKFIIDTFTRGLAEIIPELPKNDQKEVFQWDPFKYKKVKSSEFKDKYHRKNNMNLYGFKPNFIWLIKQSMFPEINKLYKKGYFTNTVLIYSMWAGYPLKDKKLGSFINKIEKMGIKMITIHTSGHADSKAMKVLNKLTNPTQTIIIHTEDNSLGKNIFNNVLDIKDDEYIVL